MTEFRTVTPDYSVTHQIGLDDVPRAAAAGFRLLICNRPDGETPGQPKAADIAEAAARAGLAFRAIPFSGQPPPAAVAEMTEALEAAAGPVLAYCRTGTRSTMAWAMAQALTGTLTPDEIIVLARNAGYDLEGARRGLMALAPRS